MFDLKKESETKKIIFVVPSELKNYFFEQKSMDPFLDYKFFTFTTLNISCHSHLAYTVYVEKSSEPYGGFPL